MGSVESSEPQARTKPRDAQRSRRRADPKRRGSGRRPDENEAARVRPIDEARIERSALAHLESHSSSVENLRRLLRRRVARWRQREVGDPSAGALDRRNAAGAELRDAVEIEAGAADGESSEAASEAIERVLVRLQRHGALDDRAYAAGLVRRLRARGGSARAIAARLSAKGVPDEVAREALRPETEQADELVAACRYARRRRLGAFRASDTQRAERRERDLAALGRAGFGYGIARRVIDAPDRSAVLDLIDGREDVRD